MTEPASCARCGAVLAPGTPACASCGQVGVTRTASCLDIIAGIIGGLFVGTTFGLFDLYVESLQRPGCTYYMEQPGLASVDLFTFGSALGIAGVAAAMGLLVYGIRSAQTGRRSLDAALLVGAAAFLLPATACMLLAVTSGRC
jgi:hypothetical protein